MSNPNAALMHKEKVGVSANYKDDAELLEIVEIFSEHITGKTNKEIAKERGVTLYSITAAITKAREHYYKELMDTGKRYFAEVWKRYEWLYDQARQEWENTKDPVFLKEMRASLDAFRKMSGLDSPPKAAVNEEGKAIPDKLILIMDASEYERKEAEYQKTLIDGGNIIEGTVIPDDPE